jgi:polysaccharide biosynthesis/export protein
MAKSRQLFFLLSLLAFVGVSCTSTQKAIYFYNMKDTTVLSTGGSENDNVIQKSAILSVQVTSLSEEASKIFNVNNTFSINAATATGSNASYTGYLVNSDGNIQMPMLGNVRAAGLTKKELRESITKIITDKKLLLEPIVTVRLLNFEVTVVGEVSKPTVITVPSEKISLLKALGLAGDITIYGNRENVLLIRENEGKKTVRRINLNDGSFIVSSPYYYLQPNDVVYVESNKDKVASVSRNRVILPSVLSVMSIAALITVTLIRNK